MCRVWSWYPVILEPLYLYCERTGPGLLGEPVNFLASFAFVLVARSIWRMAEASGLLRLMAGLTFLLCPGGLYLHSLPSAAALAAYRRLSDDERKLATYTLEATPMQHVANLPIGSRPSSRARAKAFSLADLRAIPWVFSWTQSRAGLPGWFGVGSALAALIEARGAPAIRQAVADSPFLRALVSNAELALVRADMDVAGHYARLADPSAADLFDVISAEHARTLATLRELREGREPLADRLHIAESVTRRNQVLDILCHIQIELLRRSDECSGDTRAEDALISEGMFTTIAGIAAALQTSG